ncbi:MAG: acyl-CoA synthetase [Alphaproteobacteria bacterium]|nr:acyl-CoA synthetase [Alphaproteobacteria bacterium]
MIARADTWTDLRASFRWQVPPRCNMGAALIDAHRADSVAVIQRLPDASLRPWTVGELRGQAHRLANVLVAHGLVRGDRVGVLLPQAPETVAAHVAVSKAGMMTVPMMAQFGADALAFRLGDCAARAVVRTRRARSSWRPGATVCRRSNWCCRSTAPATAVPPTTTHSSRARPTASRRSICQPTIRPCSSWSSPRKVVRPELCLLT